MVKSKDQLGLVFEDDDPGLVLEEDVGLVLEEVVELNDLETEARDFLISVKRDPSDQAIRETVQGWKEFTAKHSHLHGIDDYVLNAEFDASCGHRVRCMGTVTKVAHINFMRKHPCLSCVRLERRES